MTSDDFAQNIEGGLVRRATLARTKDHIAGDDRVMAKACAPTLGPGTGGLAQSQTWATDARPPRSRAAGRSFCSGPANVGGTATDD
jgi:hypothetical protein